jgi:iron complex transport system substrate-binding protein
MLKQAFNFLSDTHLPAIAMALMIWACNTGGNSVSESALDGEKVHLHYAEGFEITKGDSWTLVEVKRPFQGAEKGYRYLLVPESQEVPEHYDDVRLIRTPIESIVCTSTTHIPLLDYLGLTEKLVGFPTTDYISSESMRKRVDAGKVVDLGVDKGLNFERLAALQPDLVMGYTMSADYGQFRKIEEFGIPVILNAEYLEKHPLGRAEWLKYVAAFFDKGAQADSIFSAIEKNYISTSRLCAESERRPTVVSGIMYGDAWFLPGGKNYGSRILRDAGCHYLWEDDESSGYLELSFESVYGKANNADFWIGTGPFASLDELSAGDHRYKNFEAFKNKRVFNYDARKGSKGGNEYLELGYLRPDLILMDLVRIAHPECLPDHTLYFHRRLE